MKLTIKNYKPAPNIGPEGGAFSASLYADGKRVAVVSNDGWGGCNRYDPIDRGALKTVEEWAEAQHLTFDDGTEVTFEKLDWVVAELIDAEEERSWFKRQCRGKTLFRLKSDPADQWRTVNAPWTSQVGLWLTHKFGGEVAEVANRTRI